MVHHHSHSSCEKLALLCSRSQGGFKTSFNEMTVCVDISSGPTDRAWTHACMHGWVLDFEVFACTWTVHFSPVYRSSSDTVLKLKEGATLLSADMKRELRRQQWEKEVEQSGNGPVHYANVQFDGELASVAQRFVSLLPVHHQWHTLLLHPKHPYFMDCWLGLLRWASTLLWQLLQTAIFSPFCPY